MAGEYDEAAAYDEAATYDGGAPPPIVITVPSTPNITFAAGVPIVNVAGPAKFSQMHVEVLAGGKASAARFSQVHVEVIRKRSTVKPLWAWAYSSQGWGSA